MIKTALGQSRICVLLALMVCMPSAAVFPQNKKDDGTKPAQSIEELRQQLVKILEDTHTPGLSVAIVHRDGPEWVAGLGKANVAANQAATDPTLFRIGSVSKGFVALSILKLANEGRLSLQDSVRQLAPEIWFENRWEATDPVRVVDLLEHTAGWDDLHMREYAKDAKGMTARRPRLRPSLAHVTLATGNAHGLLQLRASGCRLHRGKDRGPAL